jgi:hypothetical protein
MANQDTKEKFRKKMENENTHYLERILEIRNREEWSDEKLAVIADILRARGECLPIPPPGQPAPQPVSPSPQPQGAADFFSLSSVIWIVFLAPPVLAIFWLSEFQAGQSYYQRLLSNGRTVFANVTNMEAYVDISDDPTIYRVQYSFPAVVNGGQTRISSWYSIPGLIYDSGSLKVGQTIEVVYDVSDPNKSAVNFGNWDSLYSKYYLGCLGISIAGFTLLIYSYYRARIGNKVR